MLSRSIKGQTAWVMGCKGMVLGFKILCRVPWRLAVYYHQSRDKRILPLLQAQLEFFERQDIISAGYRLDGTALETYSNIAFQAPVWCLFQVRVK